MHMPKSHDMVVVVVRGGVAVIGAIAGIAVVLVVVVVMVGQSGEGRYRK